MFFNPEIAGRLVNDRVEQRRHQAAGRRLAGPSRRETAAGCGCREQAGSAGGVERRARRSP